MSSKSPNRIWLNNIGVFEIIPNPGEGNCLFHAIAQALGQPEEHQRVRQAMVRHLTRNDSKSSKLWTLMQPSIQDFWTYSHKFSATEGVQTIQEDKDSTCCGIRKPRKAPDSFKKIYRQMMSQPGEPGTVYELRASAHLYRFHFDYLDSIFPESPSPSTSTISALSAPHSDSLHNGDGVVSYDGKMYRFYSCRNNGCKVPRDVHDSEIETCGIDSRQVYLLHTKYSDFEGHWELLQPIYLGSFPVPLHRNIFGIIYPCPSSTCLDQYLGLDGFVLQIEAQVKADPLIIPPEDSSDCSDWPNEDGDNFAGCFSQFNKSKSTTGERENKMTCLFAFARMLVTLFRSNKVYYDDDL